MKNKRNKLERKLDEYNHIMELVRTIVPIVVLAVQVVILMKVLQNAKTDFGIKVYFGRTWVHGYRDRYHADHRFYFDKLGVDFRGRRLYTVRTIRANN